MTQLLITLNEYEKRILDIVKGKFGVKNKSDAVNIVIDKFGEEMLEPELRPEFLERLEKIRKAAARIQLLFQCKIHWFINTKV